MRKERNEKEIEKIKTAIIAEALGIGTQSSQYIPGVGHIHIRIDPILVGSRENTNRRCMLWNCFGKP